MLSLLCAPLIFGQAGTHDPSFNAYAYDNYGDGTGLHGKAQAVLVQADQKLLFAGEFTDFGGIATGSLVRINPNGSLDMTYTPDLNGGNIEKALLQPDGKLLICGDFDTVNGIARMRIARLNEDGSLDPTFDPGSSVSNDGYIVSMLLLPDGKIMIGGGFDTYAGISRASIARINADGTLDETFDPGYGISGGGVLAFALQPDGKVMVGGDFSYYHETQAMRIFRVLPDGILDPDFAMEWGPNFHVSSLAVQPDGKILAGGAFTQFNFEPHGSLVRLNPGGDLDDTFDPGTGFIGTIHDIDLLSDGRMIATGSFNSFNGQPASGIIRLSASGARDLTVNPDFPASDHKYATAFQADGKLVIAGESPSAPTTYARRAISRLLTNWTQDKPFYVNPGANPDNIAHFNNGDVGDVYAVKVLADGKIVIGGDFTSYNNYISNGLVRLLPDGTPDSSFVVGTGASGIRSVLKQPDGKLIVAGLFMQFAGHPVNGIARVHANGSFDDSFNAQANGSYTSQFTRAYLQPDGKILMVGNFPDATQLVRLLPNGNIDNTFELAENVIAITALALQADGKIFIGTTDYSNGRWRRLNSNGSIDQTFLDTIVHGNVTGCAVQPDGKIIVSGSELNINNEMNEWLARLNPNGTLDTNFHRPTPYSNDVYSILLQPDGKILVGGSIAYVNGHMRKAVVRFHPNGMLDSTSNFGINTGLFGLQRTYGMALQSDGSVLCVGERFYFGDIAPRKGICRLTNDVSGFPPLELAFDNAHDVSCIGFGGATAHAYDGAAPFLYQWLTTPPITSATINLTSPGVYTCVVTDAGGDRDTASLVIAGPEFTTGFDLQANLVSTPFRPGFEATIWLDALNAGCVPASGQLKFIPDTLLDLVYVDPLPDLQLGDTLIWNFTALDVNIPHLLPVLTYNTSVLAAIGDTIRCQVLITPINGDADTLNNVRTYASPVVNGYDPNDKRVYPEGDCIPRFVDRTQPLTYTIRFQNTGNSEAINIAVLDSLDSDLNPATFRLLGKSHDMVTEFLEGNVLQFRFDNIHLADSNSNEPLSHGYVIFEIKPYANRPFGTVVRNGSAIYFDFNPAVITNTVSNTLSDGRHANSTTTFTDHSCAAYTWNGNTYTTSGTYFFHTPSIYGCDSVATLHLDLGTETFATLSVDTIDSYTLNGETYTTSGTYTQLLTNAAGCDSTITLNLGLQFTGLIENGISPFVLYPNPTRDQLTIDFKDQQQELTLLLLNLQGQEILRKHISGTKTTLDLSAFGPGIYMLSSSDSTGAVHPLQRIVKQ